MNLKPRTMVHLFFLDQVPSEEELRAAKEKGISEVTYSRSYYKLFFTGEVIGFAFGQTPLSRSLVLQCVDFTSYWDSCHATAIEYGPNGNAFNNMSSVYGSNASLFDDIVNFQAEKLVSWMRQKPQTPGLQNVSGLAGGIIRMLEAIGGVPGHSRGMNDFFTFAELRCRILAQITAEENDTTASRMLSGVVFDEWLRNGLQNIGQQVTFRDMVKLLNQYIYYDFVPNPIAKYDRSPTAEEEKTMKVTDTRSNPLAAVVTAGLTSVSALLLEAQNFAAKNFQNGAFDAVNQLSGIAETLKKVKEASANPVKSFVNSAIQVLTQRILNEDVTEAVGHEAFKAALTEVGKALANISTLPKVTFETGVKSTATTARLRNTIFRPDVFFVAPPRCNVIFPEHFTQVSYDRAYLTEVTRSLTMVYNTLVGRDALLADKVMAPNIGLDMKKIQKQVGSSGYRILMPHERHTGIIPRSEWLPTTASFGKASSNGREKQRGARLGWVDRAALFHFFKYRFGPRRASIAGRFNPYLVCGFPGLVVLKPFIIDQARLAEVAGASGKPTPQSSSEILDLVQQFPTELGAPYQIVGMIGGLTHTVDQSGGNTSISMHHARRHLGVDDEFIGVFSETIAKSVTKRIRVAVTSREAFDTAQSKNSTALTKLLVDVTPGAAQNQKDSSVTTKEKTTTTVQYQSQSVNPDTGGMDFTNLFAAIDRTVEKVSKNKNPLVTKGRIDKVDRDILVPKPPGKLTTNSQGVFGKIVGVEVVDYTLVPVPSGPYKGKMVFRSVVLHEDVSVKVDESVPVEEIIRPSWFSDKYSNAKIGADIYTPFFGTTSIIDGLQFTGLLPDAFQDVEDKEGENTAPTKKAEALQKEIKDKNATRSRLTIERAVNVLTYLYGLVKTEGKDVDQFIRDYASRPVATMVDMLGTQDFKATYDAKGAATVVSGKPGFHSLAIDRAAIDQGNLAGLLQDPDKQLPRINNSGDKVPISPVYDIRKEKLQRVDEYIVALKQGPGLKG